MKDNVEICCKEVRLSVGKLRKDFSKKISTLANKQIVETVASDIKDLKIRIPRKLDKFYMQIADQHSVAKLARHVKELAISIPEIVEKCIDEKGVSKRSKLIGLTMLEINNHNKENTFVTTSVVSSCIQLLKDNNVLVLTGRAGSGKSRNSLEILRQYKVQGYDVIKLTDLKDFEDSFKEDVKTIVLCEDIFGRTNNVFTQNSDVEILDRIVGLNEQENVKDEVILDDKVTVKLNLITLNQIIQTEPILGFPQTCCLFTGNRKFTRLGEAFFKHPSSCLTEEIENLRKSGKEKFSDKVKYSLLVYVLLNGDFLDKNQINFYRMAEIMVSCYHNEGNTISEHYLYDAIDEMNGQYLTKGYCTDSYQFQHQTVFESVLISYSRINPVLILSKFAFNFIREMVRLEGFQEKEGEIVMKIPVRYYSNLCKRIIQILQNEYCLKSQSLIQLLCDSEIMRENDVTFVEHLIDEAHRVLPLQDLKIIIAFQDESESVNFYLPVALLEHVVNQKNMTKSLFPLLEHTRSFFQNDSMNKIFQSCKASILSVFLSAVVQEHSEDILSRILNMIKDFKLTSNNDEYFTKVICSTPPTNQNLMIWLLNNIDLECLDPKAVCLEMCLRTWTNLLHLLRKGLSTSGIDLSCLIKDLCSSGKWETVKWLVDKISYSIRSAVSNIKERNDQIIQWLIENVDKSTLNMQTALNEICTTGNIHIVQWLIQNYNSIVVFDMKTALNESCRGGNVSVARWLIKNTDNALFDLNMGILAACEKNKHDVISLLINTIDPPSFDMKILLMMCHQERHDVVNHLLPLLSHFVLPEIINCAKKACEQKNLEIIEWLITNQTETGSLFDMELALNRACQVKGSIRVVQFLLKNIDHKQFNMQTAIHLALCENSLNIVEVLLDNTLFDMETFKSDVKLYLSVQNYDNDNISITKKVFNLFKHLSFAMFNTDTVRKVIVHACLMDDLDLVKLIAEKIDITYLSIDTCMKKACHRGNLKIVQWLVEHVDNTLLDIKAALNCVINENDYLIDHRHGSDIIFFLLKRFDTEKFVSDTEKWKT